MSGSWGTEQRDVQVPGPLLGSRLFVPDERWGWEFLSPQLPVPSPEINAAPMRQEAYLPANYGQLEASSKRAWRGLVRWGFVTFIFAGLAAGIPDKPWISSVVFLVGLAWTVGQFMVKRGRFKAAKARYEAQYGGVDAAHAREYAAWQQRIAEHDRREAARIAASTYWSPLRLTARPSRVDVFGGTFDGWASLLTTAGTASLAQGAAVLVLDFTEHAVVNELVDLSVAAGHPVEARDLPECLPKVNLLADLDPTDVAELVAETVHTLQATPMSPDMRGLHSNLVLAVAGVLEQPATFTRLHAGLRALRRVYDVESETLLTAGEFRQLNASVDTVGSTDQVKNELLTLTGVLDVLVREERAGSAEQEGFGVMWPERGLSVVATLGASRRKKLLDLVVFQRVLCELRGRRVTGRPMIVVAGADDVGLEGLETMARQARRAGVRLVLLLEHLRDELQKLLGGSDSVALVMRLSNPVEASAAADFIGREHTFKMSQLTKQIGNTLTEGTARSDGGSITHGTTRGYTFGGGYSSNAQGSTGSSNWSSNRSTTNSRSQTWQNSVSQSEAKSTSAGSTSQRVYEYAVEPTVVQGLEPTAFLMVEVGPGGRRAVLGDCNPGLALIEGRRAGHALGPANG
ncbi:MAG TPA: hypothetical protein VGP26_27585 [Actinophytocola sp.]|jgi:hypothetical protein|nr:hypothetical protein [Actinophytocola sp.]